MISETKKKTKTGSSVTVKMEFSEMINAIRITGNFFLSPETAISGIEKNIIGMPITITPDFLAEHIHKILGEYGASFHGITAEDIAEAVCDGLQETTDPDITQDATEPASPPDADTVASESEPTATTSS